MSERGTGRTTVLILRAIADAIEARGRPVEFVDHDEMREPHAFAGMIQSVANRIGVRISTATLSGKVLVFGEGN